MHLGMLTELDAVNSMLEAIGEMPVDTLEDEAIEDMVRARRTLQLVSRSFQAAGWHFNSRTGMVIQPSSDKKEIVLPFNCLRVDSVRCSGRIDVIQQGRRLYDNSRHTFTFEHPVTVDLVLFLPFDELIQPARDFITIRATRQFQIGTSRSTVIAQLTERSEYEAMAVFKQADLQNADRNMLWDNHLSRYTVLRDRRF